MMTESAYSQKLKKDEQTPLPIPQDQKEFIQKIQAAMVNKQLAYYADNPIARKEAVEKADNDLKKEIGRLLEIIKSDGLNDWIALCSLDENNLHLMIEVLVENPNAPMGFKKIYAERDTLSVQYRLRIGLLAKDKKEADPDVLNNIKKLKSRGFVKFSVGKCPIQGKDKVVFSIPSNALKAIAPLN